MKRYFTLLLLMTLTFRVSAQIPAALQARLEDTLTTMRDLFNFKGLSAAVAYKDAGMWKSARGLSHEGVPLTTDMLIGMGSNTKTFVSAVMLKLVESGQVQLTDTIGTWITGYDNIDGSITIRQILNHTSGLFSYTESDTYWSMLDEDIYRMWTADDILSNCIEDPYFAPGTSWQYSNTNYIIAGEIEEQVTGYTVYQLIHDSIAVPAGLANTFMPPFETGAASYAHFWSDLVGDEALDDIADWNDPDASLLPVEINSSVGAAGALVATAEDVTLFWKALMNGNIISKATLNEKMLSWTGFGSASSEYGLGVFLTEYSGNTVYAHGGTWLGQINENLSDTVRGIYITVLSNQDSLRNDYVAEVVAALYKVILDYDHSLAISAPSYNPSLVKVIPNPFCQEFRIVLDEAIGGKCTATVSDIAGRVYINASGTAEQINEVLRSESPRLRAGMYLLQLAAGNNKTGYSAKIVKY